jgi:hypothetical protein
MLKHKIMKTQRSYTAILLLLALLFAVALQASTTTHASSPLPENPPCVNSENYNAATSVEFFFEEEEYINDIPFNTRCVSMQCKYQKALKVDFHLNEEAYVDDIPFNTERIAEESLMEEAMNKTYEFEEEAYVDDIPFSTYAIAKKHNYKEQFAINE